MIKRYCLWPICGGRVASMMYYDFGDWVKYSDHITEIEAMENELSELKAANKVLKNLYGSMVAGDDGLGPEPDIRDIDGRLRMLEGHIYG